MNLADGILLGIIGLLVYLFGFMVVYIIYGRYRKDLERIEADKKKTTSFDFK